MNPRITWLPETRQDDRETQPDGGLGALVTTRGNLPLDSVDIRVCVTGTLAGVELAQGVPQPLRRSARNDLHLPAAVPGRGHRTADGGRRACRRGVLEGTVRLTAVADIDPAGLPLTRITSSLPMQASDEAPDGHTIVRLEPGERLDRDFILRLAVAQHGQVASSLSAACDDGRAGEGTFTLTILPPTDAAPPRPRDVVIVLDRSGSMRGWKMTAGRRAAARIVDTLTAADRFALLCFDNVTERPPGLSAGLAMASDRHRKRHA